MYAALPALLIMASSPLSSVSESRLRADVEKLASFPTRNTLSPQLLDAANWVADQFRAIPGLKVELMRYTAPKGRRVPEDTSVVQVVATWPGQDERRIVIGGHMDSLNLKADVLTGRAPGANDDASGVAVTLEAARNLCTRTWPHTLVFVAFTGEEQGLLGSRALATMAAEQHWSIDAVLSNDTVGSSSNKAGQKDEHRVRIFSDEPKGTAQSRELARYIEFATRDAVPHFGPKLVFRRDRFGRGGDHTPFHEAGFSAVRFVEVHEEYTRQHTEDDLPQHMDFRYLANVARLNIAALQALAQAGRPPEDVRVVLDQAHDTTLTWRGTGRHRVYWRETTSPIWQGTQMVDGERATIKGVNKDDHTFAVGAENGIPVVAQ